MRILKLIIAFFITLSITGFIFNKISPYLGLGFFGLALVLIIKNLKKF